MAQLPIWIRLPGLKLHLSSDKMLSKIASLIGKSLFTDRMTAKIERLTNARVHMEINLGSELPDEIPIYDQDGKTTRRIVEYEWSPL